MIRRGRTRKRVLAVMANMVSGGMDSRFRGNDTRGSGNDKRERE